MDEMLPACKPYIRNLIREVLGYSHTLSRGKMGFLPESIMPPRPIERSSRAEGA